MKRGRNTNKTDWRDTETPIILFSILSYGLRRSYWPTCRTRTKLVRCCDHSWTVCPYLNLYTCMSIPGLETDLVHPDLGCMSMLRFERSCLDLTDLAQPHLGCTCILRFDQSRTRSSLLFFSVRVCYAIYVIVLVWTEMFVCRYFVCFSVWV